MTLLSTLCREEPPAVAGPPGPLLFVSALVALSCQMTWQLIHLLAAIGFGGSEHSVGTFKVKIIITEPPGDTGGAPTRRRADQIAKCIDTHATRTWGVCDLEAMAKWMGLEIPFWLLVVIGLGLVLLVILMVRRNEILRVTYILHDTTPAPTYSTDSYKAGIKST